MFCHRLSNVDLSLISQNVKLSTWVKGQNYVDSKFKVPSLCFSGQEVNKSPPSHSKYFLHSSVMIEMTLTTLFLHTDFGF